MYNDSNGQQQKYSDEEATAVDLHDNNIRDDLPPRTIDTFMDEAYQSSLVHDQMTRIKLQMNFWVMFIVLGVCNSSDATEILALSYILGLDDDKSDFKQTILKNDLSRNGGILASSIFFGMLIGGILVGVLGDQWGRKNVLMTGLITNGSAGILSACASNLTTLTCARFIAGIGIGGSVPPLFALAAELSPPICRGLAVTIVASFWMVGSIFVSLVALVCFGSNLDFSWRVFLIICSLPSIVGAFFVSLMIPESPRFLAKQGQYYEASKVTNSLTTLLGHFTPSPITQDEIRESLSLPERSDFSGTPGIHESLKGILTLYNSNVALCRLTLITQSLWFSISFGSYGLITWINAIFEEVKLRNIYGNALLFAVANLPGNVFTAYFVDSLGRRKVLIISMGLASLSIFFFAVVIASKSSNESLYVMLFACAFQAFSVSGWNTIGVLTSETFPTEVRSTGVGICSSSGRIGSMIAQIINGALIDKPEILLSVSALFLCFGAITAYFLPSDFSRQPLQDSIETSDLIIVSRFQNKPPNRLHDSGNSYVKIQSR